MTRSVLAFALAVLAGATPHAQHAHHAPAHAPATPETERFLEEARAALVRFRRVDAAVAAGYRPLGPDMPHMGQHWVHPGRAVRGTVVASEPAMLTYLLVGRDTLLTGAAYTVPVGPGAAPPAFPSPGAWHAHAGDLLDEAFGVVPHGTRDASQPRLAMLHAWTEAPNPNGVWAADHWGLPFVRLGLPVPAHVPPDAGRAVALVAGYRAFFREGIRRAAQPSADELAHAERVLDGHAARIRERLAEAPGDVAGLADAWRALWDDLSAGLQPATAQALAPVLGAGASAGTHGIAPVGHAH